MPGALLGTEGPKTTAAVVLFGICGFLGCSLDGPLQPQLSWLQK